MKKEDIQKAIIDDLQVDDQGIQEVTTIDIKELIKLGVEDVNAFLEGCLDAHNENDFNDSSEDYIKGYKYGKTGSF